MKSLNVNVFFRCNARCVFCVVGLSGGDRSNRELDVAQVEAELERGSRAGCRSVTFSGGEPTVYRGLPEVVAYARDLGYVGIEIKTNGIRLCREDVVGPLVAAGVNLFSISIHGPTAEVHDPLVGVPRAHERALAGARRVRELGAMLSLPTCIQQANYRYLPETVELLLSLGPRFVLPTFIEPSGSAAFRFDEVVPRYSDVRPYVEEACRLLEAGSGYEWALHGFPMCRLPGREQFSYDLVRGEEVLGDSDTEDYYRYEQETFRAKAESCSECSFESLCGGPWREYVHRHGWDEFVPIGDRTPREAIPLPMIVRALYSGSQATPGVCS